MFCLFERYVSTSIRAGSRSWPLISRWRGSHQLPFGIPSAEAYTTTQALPQGTLSTPQSLCRPPKVKTVKRIQRASRDLVALKLATILREVTEKNDIACWTVSTGLSLAVSKPPRSGGHRRSLCSTLNKLINEETDLNLICSRSSLKLNLNTVESLAVRVTGKLEEGDCRGEIRIASSDDCMAEVNDVTVSRLRQIHSSHPDSIIPTLSSKETFTSIEVFKYEVLKAIRYFPNRSADGSDNLRTQHLNDMTAVSAEGGDRLLSLEALTSFVNMFSEVTVFPMSVPSLLS